MIHINNRSDFSIVWKMPNGGILPSFPYTLEFSTRGGLRYAVKSDDESRFIPKPDADVQAALAAKPNVTLADAGASSSGVN